MACIEFGLVLLNRYVKKKLMVSVSDGFAYCENKDELPSGPFKCFH